MCTQQWIERRSWNISARIVCAPFRALLLLSLALAVFGAAPSAAQTSRPDEPARQGDSSEVVWEGEIVGRVYEPYQRWVPGESPASATSELDAIYKPAEALLEAPPLDGPIDRFLEATASLEEATGLRLGFAYTMIFQQASGGPGRRRGASGDFDIIGAWTLLGRDTPDTGTLVFSFEERHKIGPLSANALRGELGTLHPPTNGFNDRGFVVRDIYWIQRLFEDRFRFAFGRGDTSDFFGAHRMQSLNVSFSNRAFSANTVVPSPGHGLFAGFSVRPSDQFYATIGGANAYGQTSINDMKYLSEGDFFTFGEFGFTPEIEGLGSGRYRAVLWHMDARGRRDIPSDKGFSIILDQDLGEQLLAFARYGYADEAITSIRSSFEIGGGIRGLLGSPDNMTGVAFAYSEPTQGSDEKVIEAFQRWQLTRHSQFTLGVQGIFDPSNSDADSLAVFTVRYRITF
ncbi:MAG: hypothetical protein EA376_01135 [Phycisphaeraceae bacterium]|nr:MAG: hypothetical protein EA376_01135 [Phycisphaeraceae bacterium]